MLQRLMRLQPAVTAHALIAIVFNIPKLSFSLMRVLNWYWHGKTIVLMEGDGPSHGYVPAVERLANVVVYLGIPPLDVGLEYPVPGEVRLLRLPSKPGKFVLVRVVKITPGVRCLLAPGCVFACLRSFFRRPPPPEMLNKAGDTRPW